MQALCARVHRDIIRFGSKAMGEEGPFIEPLCPAG